MTDVDNNGVKWGEGKGMSFHTLPKLVYSKNISKKGPTVVYLNHPLPQSRPLLTHRSHPLLPRYCHRPIPESLVFPGEDIIEPEGFDTCITSDDR